MHRLRSRSFEQRLGEAVAEIERGTAAEIVVVVVPRSDRHAEVALGAGLVALLVVFTALVFVDAAVGDYLLYAGPIVAFVAAFGLVSLAPPLLRVLLGERRRRRATEILARATFQKAGLSRTREATAILVFLSLVERACVLVCDHGALLGAAESEWATFEQQLGRALGARDADAAVLEALRGMGRLLHDRLPARPDDVDELPSRIRVSF